MNQNNQQQFIQLSLCLVHDTPTTWYTQKNPGWTLKNTISYINLLLIIHPENNLEITIIVNSHNIRTVYSTLTHTHTYTKTHIYPLMIIIPKITTKNISQKTTSRKLYKNCEWNFLIFIYFNFFSFLLLYCNLLCSYNKNK